MLWQALVCFLLLSRSCNAFNRTRRLLSAGDHAWPRVREAEEGLKTCSVYILDIAKDLDLSLPSCDLNKNFVSRRGYIFGAYSEHLGDSDIGFHYASQHAGPYWVKKGLQRSKVVTDDMSEADVILVDDYCYHLASITIQHGDRDWAFINVKAVMDAAYQAISWLPRFAEKKGRDFAFFYPHPWTGGDAYHRCVTLEHSLHINVEKEPNWGCESEDAKVSQLVVPYSSTDMINGVDDASEDKDIFALLMGRCGEGGGKLIRTMLVEALSEEFSRYNVKVKMKCTSSEDHFTHQALRFIMQRSTFCLVPSGDTSSSRRLTEIILTGCIPVFLGPFWHTMPLAEYVSYRDLGVYIYVEELAEHKKEWGTEVLDIRKSLALTEKSWWTADQIPDADVQDLFELAPRLTDIANILLAKTDGQIRRMRQAVLDAQHFFMYQHHTASDEALPIISDAILDSMCRQAEKQVPE